MKLTKLFLSLFTTLVISLGFTSLIANAEENLEIGENPNPTIQYFDENDNEIFPYTEEELNELDEQVNQATELQKVCL